MEAQTIARACGKAHLHNLEPEDLVALTIEAAAMARVPLAGTGLDRPAHEAPVAEASCLYTTTPDEDFVLDRTGPFVVVSPCSGHGAKFTPLIGAMAADLALGRAEPHPRFALSR
jgi:glycine/D-amino acid oxidase-like deaminating enzyme